MHGARLGISWRRLRTRVPQPHLLCLQLQGIQVLHDSQLRTLPGYQGDAEFGEAAAAAAVS